MSHMHGKFQWDSPDEECACYARHAAIGSLIEADRNLSPKTMVAAMLAAIASYEDFENNSSSKQAARIWVDERLRRFRRDLCGDELLLS